MASGITADETPCSARPTISTPSEVASAQITEPITSSTMATISMDFLPYMSPSRDSSGVATAPTSSVAVKTHVTVATEVWNAATRLGSSGSTSVCMTDTTRPAVASASRVSPPDAAASRAGAPGRAEVPVVSAMSPRDRPPRPGRPRSRRRDYRNLLKLSNINAAYGRILTPRAPRAHRDAADSGRGED
jgi:hypothetical protein